MKLKIGIPIVIMLGGVFWLAFANLGKADYFYKVDELPQLGDAVFQNEIKVKGRIVSGSIKSETKPVVFTIQEEGKELVVRYVGDEPLPDMFKDHAETVVHGTMRADGVFEAKHIQAKCASKYEAAAPDISEGQS